MVCRTAFIPSCQRCMAKRLTVALQRPCCLSTSVRMASAWPVVAATRLCVSGIYTPRCRVVTMSSFTASGAFDGSCASLHLSAVLLAASCRRPSSQPRAIQAGCWWWLGVPTQPSSPQVGTDVKLFLRCSQGTHVLRFEVCLHASESQATTTAASGCGLRQPASRLGNARCTKAAGEVGLQGRSLCVAVLCRSECRAATRCRLVGSPQVHHQHCMGASACGAAMPTFL